MVRLAELDSRVNIWMTEQHISSNFSALDCHSATCHKVIRHMSKLCQEKTGLSAQ